MVTVARMATNGLGVAAVYTFPSALADQCQTNAVALVGASSATLVAAFAFGIQELLSLPGVFLLLACGSALLSTNAFRGTVILASTSLMVGGALVPLAIKSDREAVSQGDAIHTSAWQPASFA